MDPGGSGSRRPSHDGAPPWRAWPATGFHLGEVTTGPPAGYSLAVRQIAERRAEGRAMSLNEYEPGSTFPGRIGRTTDESTPAWPRPVRARPGTPNVLMIVLDDTGYGHLGCFGSPIATPHLDALATGGLRYTNMHTTALCSPSRSCVVTGRNHHSNGMASITRAGHRLSGLRRHDPVRERHAVGDPAAARLQHVHDRQVAPDAVRARVRRRTLRPLAAGHAASTASTASSAATPASGIRTWSTTTTRSSRRAVRSRATT